MKLILQFFIYWIIYFKTSYKCIYGKYNSQTLNLCLELYFIFYKDKKLFYLIVEYDSCFILFFFLLTNQWNLFNNDLAAKVPLSLKTCKLFI